MKILTTILVTSFLLLTTQISMAKSGRKCCHKNGGIARCDKTAKHLCKNGKTSNCKKHNHK